MGNMMKKNNLGFTLTELLIVVAIMGIMAAFATPSLTKFIASTRITNRAEQLANLLRFAKGEAVRLNAPVVVCGTDIRIDGRPLNNCGGVDSNGWRAFADIDRNGTYDASKDLDLRTISLNGTRAQEKKVSLSVQFFDITGKSASKDSTELVFMPNGTFGSKKAGSLSSLTIGDSYVRLTMTDVENPNDRNPQKRLVTVTPNGVPTVCLGKDEKVQQDGNKINLGCGLK
ncbi:type IV fimbrial biogenesis protein FimT [Alysiella filiformis DSM 16848]|uniref:Type II secretion system protein H n=2 Tax=Alysiella TaxID=194195 RepID=A0A286EFT6_9NEIS|nr:type IV fimbrial biogenesis protein FimT [Alysiella filiformis DSM 16848]